MSARPTIVKEGKESNDSQNAQDNENQNVQDNKTAESKENIEDLKKFIEQKLISMNNGGKGVKIGHLAQQGKGAGISSIKLEELIDALKHEGRIYEPKNGILMPTEGGK